jgi:hypothetical protein
VTDEAVLSSIDFPESLYRVPNLWLMDDKTFRRIGVDRSVFTAVITGNILHEYIQVSPSVISSWMGMSKKAILQLRLRESFVLSDGFKNLTRYGTVGPIKLIRNS